MHTGSGRCSIFAMRTTSDYLPRLASAARRVQGPRSGTFRKLEPETPKVQYKVANSARRACSLQHSCPKARAREVAQLVQNDGL